MPPPARGRLRLRGRRREAYTRRRRGQAGRGAGVNEGAAGDFHGVYLTRPRSTPQAWHETFAALLRSLTGA